jgi:uncharacterized membrane protein (UPF0136 family)
MSRRKRGRDSANAGSCALRHDFLSAVKIAQEIFARSLGIYSVKLDRVALLDYQCATRMIGPAKIYFIIFGVLTIAGGIIGYVKAGSMPSIIAGSITGILLVIGALILPEHRAAGLLTVLIVSLLLAAQFIPKFIRTGKAMPAGMMSILSAIGVVVAIVAWMKK